MVLLGEAGSVTKLVNASSSYHIKVLAPEQLPFKEVLSPEQILTGEIPLGAAGIGFTITSTPVELGLVHPFTVQFAV